MPPSSAMLHYFFFTVTAAFCLPISMQPNHQQINNVPQWTLLSLRISSAHGGAAAHTLIIPSFSDSFTSPSPFLVRYKFFFFFRVSYDLSLLPPSLFSPVYITSNTLRLFYFLPLFFLSFFSSHTLIPFSHHLPLICLT